MEVWAHKERSPRPSNTKPPLAETKQIVETVSAFSNADGGVILIGVSDTGEVGQVDIGKGTLEKLAEQMKRNTDPLVFPSIELVEKEGRTVISIEVKESPIKPVFAYDRVYKRVGRTNQRLSSEEIREMTREGVDYCFTEQICKEASLEDIDEEKIKEFVKSAEEERNYEIEYKEKEDFLKKLDVSTKEGLRYAALLLFGKDSQRFMVQSSVQCGRFKGIAPLEFVDMQNISGDTITQVDSVLRFIKKNLKVGVTFTGEARRTEKWEYPMPAVREAVINAVCHRDYGDSGNVQIRIFDDRLEIWNPGGLPKELTVEDLKKEHRSIPRNKQIANAFFMLKLIERWGSGTNKIIKECEKEGFFVEFEDQKYTFITRIYGDKFTEEFLKTLGLNERQMKAVLRIKEKEKITNKEYQEVYGVSRATATRELSELIDKHVLVRAGRGRRDLYYVIKPFMMQK